MNGMSYRIEPLFWKKEDFHSTRATIYYYIDYFMCDLIIACMFHINDTVWMVDSVLECFAIICMPNDCTHVGWIQNSVILTALDVFWLFHACFIYDTIRVGDFVLDCLVIICMPYHWLHACWMNTKISYIDCFTCVLIIACVFHRWYNMNHWFYVWVFCNYLFAKWLHICWRNTKSLILCFIVLMPIFF